MPGCVESGWLRSTCFSRHMSSIAQGFQRVLFTMNSYVQCHGKVFASTILIFACGPDGMGLNIFSAIVRDMAVGLPFACGRRCGNKKVWQHICRYMYTLLPLLEKQAYA